jgi:hypothetical protein
MKSHFRDIFAPADPSLQTEIAKECGLLTILLVSIAGTNQGTPGWATIDHDYRWRFNNKKWRSLVL